MWSSKCSKWTKWSKLSKLSKWSKRSKWLKLLKLLTLVKQPKWSKFAYVLLLMLLFYMNVVTVYEVRCWHNYVKYFLDFAKLRQKNYSRCFKIYWFDKILQIIMKNYNVIASFGTQTHPIPKLTTRRFTFFFF